MSVWIGGSGPDDPDLMVGKFGGSVEDFRLRYVTGDAPGIKNRALFRHLPLLGRHIARSG
jgi:hypothetical protein